MKTKFTVLLAVFCCIISSVQGNTISVQDAQNVALNFFTIASGNTASKTSLSPTLKYTRTEADGTVSLYAFDMVPAKGFVIVSASDYDNPIIGYSTESSFAPNFSKTGLNDWLSRWGQEISYVEKNHIAAGPKVAMVWSYYRQGIAPATEKSAGVAPLCTTTWNQSDNSGNMPLYNEDCPYDIYAGINAITGCIATAMSQIMKYWNFPARGTGIATYNDEIANGFLNDYGVQTFNFNTTPFNWANMPGALTSNSSAAQDSAVSLLNFACGVSVDMDYRTYASGAWVLSSESTNGASAQQAYTLYFKYNPHTLQGVLYNNYNNAAWIALLENELNEGRPVQYEGYDVSSGGHTWVCDGYNTSDMMHMNWGWGGLDNGFFAITSLDANGFDFTYNLAALIGIEPGVEATAAPAVICAGDTSVLSVTGGPVIATYAWAPSTGLSCTASASPKALPITTTTYTVTADSAGNSVTSNVTVYVNHPHTLNYALSDSQLCNGNSATLSFVGASGVSINPASSVFWQDSLSALLTPDSTTTYQLTTQSSVCGTRDSANITVPVTQHAPVTFNLSATTICNGSSATLSYTGLSNVTVSPAGYSYNGGPNIMVFNPYYTTNFSVSGTTSCGSVYTDTFTITVSPDDGSLSYALSKPTICRGDTSVLTVYSASNVQVEPGNMVTSLGNYTYLLVPDSNTTFYISGYSAACGGQVSAQVPVNVIQTGSLSYAVANQDLCEGGYETIYLNGVTGNIQSNPPLYFYFSDSADAYAYFVADTTTTYNISATTICGTGGTANITVTVLPYVSFDEQQISICVGDSSLYTVLGLTGITIYPATGFRMIDSNHYEFYPSANTTYELDGYDCTGDYNYSSLTINVVQPGVFNYTLQDSNQCSEFGTALTLNGVYNPQITPFNYLYMADSIDYYTSLYPTTTTTYTMSAQSICGGTVSASFTVHVFPTAGYSLSSNAVCPGGSTTLTVTGLANPSIYPGDAVNWINDSVAVLSPVTETYYDLSGTDCTGGEDDFNILIGVLTGGTGVTYSVDSELCSGDDAYLTISGASNIVVTPSVNLNYIDSFDAYAYLYPTVSTTYTITGQSECINAQVKDTFNVYIVDHPSYSLSNQTVCNNDSVIIEALGLYGMVIDPFTNVSYINENTAYLYPTSTTTYTLSGSTYCSDQSYSQSFTLTVGSSPVQTDALDSVICAGNSTEICASAGFVSYQWSTGQSGLCIGATLSDYYSVTGTDAYNCTSQSTPLYLSVLSGNALNITERHDTLFASMASSYQWMLNNTAIQNATGPFIVPASTGNYTVELSGAGNCSEISNAFNFTGINDLTENPDYKIYPNPSAGSWILQTSEPEAMGNTCEIFDNEGRLVYHSIITGSKYEIDAELSSGIYLMKILDEGQAKFIAKLVKM